MIKFVGFLPDKNEHFVSMVMLLVGSIVEITYQRWDGEMKNEVVLLSGATDQHMYFTRTLAMQKHAWMFRRIAEKKEKPSSHHSIEWSNIKSIIYIGNYDEASEYLVTKAYA